MEPKSNAFWEQPVLVEDGLYSFNIANYSIPTLDAVWTGATLPACNSSSLHRRIST